MIDLKRLREDPAPFVEGAVAKGIDDKAQPLTYSGPSEDGSVEVKRSGGAKPSGNGGGSRRERREAARQRGRHAKDSKR